MTIPLPPADEAYLFDVDVPPVTEFRGQWHALSNFFPAVFDLEGIRWPNAEAAFNGLKTLNPDERARIAAAPNAREAKTRGQKVTLRPEWDRAVRHAVMKQVLHAKFTAHPARVVFLLSTGSALLVEGNRWEDTHWGACFCQRHNGAGENHLGRALMRLRADLRSGH